MNWAHTCFSFCWIYFAASRLRAVETANGKYAQKLFNDLFEDYSNALRPVEDTDKVLNVTLQITLSQIKDMIWQDAYLTWDRDQYDGLDSIRIPSDLVWRPDIVLYNKADDESSESMNTNVVLRYDGLITWDAPAITKSSCVVDVTYFPFDSQQCNLTFGSWTYNGNQVDIFNALDSGDLSDFIEDVEWEVHGMPAVKNVISYGCCSEPYPDVTFTLLLKRRSSFYIVNLLIPCVLISFLAPLSFYLPAASGEKVSLGVTILLAMTVFQLMVAEIMPASENVPLIGKYYIATMALITASTALTIMVMNIHFCGTEARPVPHWARVVILKYMARILFVYDVGESCLSLCHGMEQGHLTKVYGKLPESSLKTARNKDLSKKKEMNKLLKNNLGCQREMPQDAESYCARYETLMRNIEYIARCLKDHKANNSKGSEWKKVAKVIDRFFMWIFFIMVFVMTILIIARVD
ncbi:neuronal acetylcholine receptor subunit alpha-9 isoform X3 [Fukomys damarensis]|uniref:neuronal acetylcholine receptor subunit alpha-9 isoform X3 n=1 Tax=Fukomys damarensis TaxID=885580 RepID=UPI001455A882|nr:neuronal acetylcholine receptor subunit alpha-9 isoform X3 [Fukomys damarensis]